MKYLPIVLSLFLLSYQLPAQSEAYRNVLTIGIGNWYSGIALSQISSEGGFNSFSLAFSASDEVTQTLVRRGNLLLQWTKTYPLASKDISRWYQPYMGFSFAGNSSAGSNRALISSNFPQTSGSLSLSGLLNTGAYGFIGRKFFWRLDAGMQLLRMGLFQVREHNPSLSLEQQTNRQAEFILLRQFLPQLVFHVGISL